MKIKVLIDLLKGETFDFFGNVMTDIIGVSTIFKPKRHSCTWASKENPVDWANFNFPSNLLIVTSDKTVYKFKSRLLKKNVNVLVSEKPRNIFSKIFRILTDRGYLTEGSWFGHNRKNKSIFVHQSAIYLSPIDYDKTQYLFIGPNAFLSENVKLGNNLRIGASTIIGGDGFGFYEEALVKRRMPHVGGVIIEDNVEIGSNVTIDRGTIENTIIRKNAKIDNLSHIAHNVTIGENVAVVSNVTLSGSCEIGANTWIGPNSVVREGVKVGESCLIGIGSVVIRDIPDGEVWAGNPAKLIKQRN